MCSRAEVVGKVLMALGISNRFSSGSCCNQASHVGSSGTVRSQQAENRPAGNFQINPLQRVLGRLPVCRFIDFLQIFRLNREILSLKLSVFRHSPVLF